ncbi:hypothetical protein GC176_25465 [bacterium]|nr:hypothetical protein [bacterium]
MVAMNVTDVLKLCQNRRIRNAVLRHSHNDAGLRPLSPERAQICGGFVDYGGEDPAYEEAMTEPTDEAYDYWLTPEEMELYMEIMLFGEPVEEDWSLTTEEYEQLMLEALGL